MSKTINTQLMEYQISSIEKRFDALEKKVDDMFTLIMSMALNNKHIDIKTECETTSAIATDTATSAPSTSAPTPESIQKQIISTQRRRTII